MHVQHRHTKSTNERNIEPFRRLPHLIPPTTNPTMSDPNVSTETGESLQGRSPRFTQWIAFLVFSTITLGSSVEVVSEVTLHYVK
jgi:hypothetical protein